jgi:hypothetical protein
MGLSKRECLIVGVLLWFLALVVPLLFLRISHMQPSIEYLRTLDNDRREKNLVHAEELVLADLNRERRSTGAVLNWFSTTLGVLGAGLIGIGLFRNAVTSNPSRPAPAAEH